MKGCWLISACICLGGCAANSGLQYEAMSETNMYHIARLRKGMSEKQALQIMHKPYSYETFQVGDDIYDVWFYVTRTTGLGQTRMVPQNLTPITFKNGVLVGTGYSWYYFAMKEQANQVSSLESEDQPQPDYQKTQEQEDLEFEKALKSNTPKTSAPQTSTPPVTAPQQNSSNKPKQQEKLPQNVHIISASPRVEPQTPLAQAGLPLAVSTPLFKKVKRGMSPEQVTDLLGDPQSQESFTMDGQSYLVWFYQVEPRWGKNSAETMPLIFKNESLVGNSMKDYNQLKQQAETSSSSPEYDEGAERLQEDESEQNFDFW